MHLSFHLAASDSTCRLDVDEEVHLPSTSFLKAILERVDGWRINIFLRQTIPSVYNALEKSADVHRIDNFSSPAFRYDLWYNSLQPCGRNVTRRWLIIPLPFGGHGACIAFSSFFASIFVMRLRVVQNCFVSCRNPIFVSCY